MQLVQFDPINRINFKKPFDLFYLKSISGFPFENKVIKTYQIIDREL